MTSKLTRVWLQAAAPKKKDTIKYHLARLMRRRWVTYFMLKASSIHSHSRSVWKFLWKEKQNKAHVSCFQDTRGAECVFLRVVYIPVEKLIIHENCWKSPGIWTCLVRCVTLCMPPLQLNRGAWHERGVCIVRVASQNWWIQCLDHHSRSLSDIPRMLSGVGWFPWQWVMVGASPFNYFPWWKNGWIILDFFQY